MMLHHTRSDAALLSHATPDVFARGQACAASGAVTHIVQRGARLSALVESNQEYGDHAAALRVAAHGLTLQRLGLSRSGHLVLTCTVGTEGAYFSRAHLVGMAGTVKKDAATDPCDRGFFGTHRILVPA